MKSCSILRIRNSPFYGLVSFVSSFLVVFQSVALGFLATSKPVHASVLDPVINEVVIYPSIGNKWVELYNPNSSSFDLSGWKLNNCNLVSCGGPVLTFSSGTTINGDDYLVVEEGPNFTFTLDHNPRNITLFDSNDNPITKLSYPSDPGTDKSWGWLPNGDVNGTLTNIDSPTKGASNGAGPDIVPPAIPGVVSPIDNSFVTTHDFDFVWETVSDVTEPVSYDYKYAYSLATNPADNSFTFPSGSHLNLAASTVPSHGTPDNVYYWQVRACDAIATPNCSNWSGPWKVTVDTTDPNDPDPTSLVSTSHTADVPSNDNTIDISWGVGFDSGSGVAGYYYDFTHGVSDEPGTSHFTLETSVTDYQLDDATDWYFHLATADNAGNVTSTLHLGPFIIDTARPTADLVFGGTGSAYTGFTVVFSESVVASEATDGANYFLHNWPGAGVFDDLSSYTNILYDDLSKTSTIVFTDSNWYISPEQLWGVTGVHDLAGNLINPNPTEETSTPMENPTVFISYPVDTIYGSSTWGGNITGTAFDPNYGSGVSKVEVKIDDGDWVVASGTNNWSYTYAPSSTGSYTISTKSTDNAGNVSDIATQDFSWDATAPTTTISLGSPNYTVGDTTFVLNTTTFTLSAFDLGDFFTEVDDTFYSIDSGLEQEYSGEFTLASLSEGQHTIEYWSTDTVGNTEAKNSVLIDASTKAFLDTSFPSSTITYPADGEIYNLASWTGSILGTASDGDGSGVSGNTLTITRPADGFILEDNAGGTTNWSYSYLPNVDGSYRITSTTTDNLGQGSSDTVDFVWDVIGSMVNSFLADQDFVKWGDTIEFESNITDDNGVASAKLEFATDSSFTTPANPQYEDLSNISGSTWSLNYPTPTTFLDGRIFARIIAIDTAGNETISTTTDSFIVDNNAPTISGTPTTTTPTNDSTPTWTWTASSDTNFDKYVFYFDTVSGGELNSVNTGLTNNYTHTSTLSDGTWYAKVKAYDKVGNSSTSLVGSVVIDTTPPVSPSPISPADGHVTKGVAFTQRWSSVTDAVQYRYQSCNVDPGDLGGACSSVRYTSTPSSATSKAVGAGQLNSHFWWRVQAKDSVGNWSFYGTAYELIIDNSSPTVLLNSYSTDYTNDNTPTYTGTSVDIYDAGVEKVEYRIVNNLAVEVVPWTLTTGTTSFSFTPETLLDGTYTFYARATDRAGNVSSTSSDTLQIDTVKPASAITLPTNTGNEAKVYLNTWNGAIAGTATDNTSGVGLSKVELSIQRDSDKYYWNGESWGVYGSELLLQTSTENSFANWTYTLLNPAFDETYFIKSHATDLAGNYETTYKITVVYDKTIPQVALTINPTNPDGENSWYTSKPTITLTGTDANFNKIEYQLNSQAGSWSIYTIPVTVNEGTTKFYYSASDLAGNLSEVGLKNVAVDLTNPKDAEDFRTTAGDAIVTLEWGKSPSDDIDHYTIYRSDNKNFIPNPESELKEVSASTRNYDDEDVDNDTKYYYYIIAFDTAGRNSDAVGAYATPATTEEEAEAGVLPVLFVPQGQVEGINTEGTGGPFDGLRAGEGIDGKEGLGEVQGTNTEEAQNNTNTTTQGFSLLKYWWLILLILAGILGVYLYKKSD